HRGEIAADSGGNWRHHASAQPFLPGALRLALEGYITGGCKRNRSYLADKVRAASSVPQDFDEVAFDPQTSGGLLIAVPGHESQALVRDLHAEGVLAAAVVGEVLPRGEVWVELL